METLYQILKMLFVLVFSIEQIWVMAFDADGLCFPILTGLRFDGYDSSVIRIVGTRIYPVSPGDARVYVHWHGFTSSFVVHVSP